MQSHLPSPLPLSAPRHREPRADRGLSTPRDPGPSTPRDLESRGDPGRWDHEIELLAQALPPHLYNALHERTDPAQLLEIVLDLGREPEARVPGREILLSTQAVTETDLEYVASRVGQFGDDNRAGIERTLHRVSAIRNRRGRIVGLTCRVGRAVTRTAEIFRDIVESGQSVLLLGRPGIGKTTMLRESARLLADEQRKRVVIVDTSNEIGGDGDIPHPGIGRARRMQVRTPLLQHSVMIEAVENHMPEVIVIDEIGTELESAAARTIAERGVQLIATAHGQTLENLLVNPTLNDLLGGIQTVTLSDEEARRRGTQKTVLERKAPPTFDVLIEIQDRERVAIHQPLAEVVDAALRGPLPTARIRMRTREGRIISNAEDTVRTVHVQGGNGGNGSAAQHENGRVDGAGTLSALPARKPRTVFPYGVSRLYLEQSIRELDLPVRVLGNLDGADLVLTLKNYYRRRPDILRQAESGGVPVHILKSNSVAQVKEALGRLYVGERLEPGLQRALDEALDAIRKVKATLQPQEITPQNAYIRRLQHQLVSEHELVARSTGKEPQRRLRILPAPDVD
ncbi:MAG TPA: R3H domain-containing nucleic acid-binding protein [Candidatus Dormibacteraeota bacterium]|nr:R3H domain-containing nucleic acid-binding protein [Candidatus Dormibacteraeota bacterium]